MFIGKSDLFIRSGAPARIWILSFKASYLFCKASYPFSYGCLKASKGEIWGDIGNVAVYPMIVSPLFPWLS